MLKVNGLAIVMVIWIAGCATQQSDKIDRSGRTRDNTEAEQMHPFAYAPAAAPGVVWTSKGDIRFLVSRNGDNIIPAEIQHKLVNGGMMDTRIKPLLHPLFWAVQ